MVDRSDVSIMKTYDFFGAGRNLKIIIKTKLEGAYSSFIWPSALVLSEFIFQNSELFCGKRGIELGSGSGFSGIMCAKIGAIMTLTDSHEVIKNSNLIHENVTLNQLCLSNKSDFNKVEIKPVTWGIWFDLKDRIYDFIIASDCFYDPDDFENILATVSLILENNKSAIFYCVYHIRNVDWNIECFLQKWNLKCEQINCDEYVKPHINSINTFDLLKISLNR